MDFFIILGYVAWAVFTFVALMAGFSYIPAALEDSQYPRSVRVFLIGVILIILSVSSAIYMCTTLSHSPLAQAEKAP